MYLYTYTYIYIYMYKYIYIYICIYGVLFHVSCNLQAECCVRWSRDMYALGACRELLLVPLPFPGCAAAAAHGVTRLDLR